MAWVCLGINATALIYGGICDYRRREIPNIVPLLLLLSGLIQYEKIVQHFAAMLGVIALLLLSRLCSKKQLPGGDVKLLCSLAFAVGASAWAGTFLTTGLLILIYSILKKLPLNRSVPLCTYVASAFTILALLSFNNNCSFFPIVVI